MAGTLYRGYSPALPTDWPWQFYPPFLGREVAVFSQDTLPHVLHRASTLPLYKVCLYSMPMTMSVQLYTIHRTQLSG